MDKNYKSSMMVGKNNKVIMEMAQNLAEDIAISEKAEKTKEVDIQIAKKD